MTITKIPIWLDCDPGHDDAMAILLGCFHPAFELLGISTCFGNAPPENTDYNARSLLTAMGKAQAIPVYKGARGLGKENLITLLTFTVYQVWTAPRYCLNQHLKQELIKHILKPSKKRSWPAKEKYLLFLPVR